MKNLTLIIPAKAEADSLPKVLEEIKNFNCSIIVVLESSDTETIKATKKNAGTKTNESIIKFKKRFACVAGTTAPW